MQEAFRECHGLQCGYCTPGMVMAAVGLLDENPHPDRAGGAARPRGQPLSLHRLPQHREGGAGCRRPTGATHDRHRRAPAARSSAPAWCAGRTRRCSPARPSTPTTSSSPARCTSPCCAAPTPTPASRSIDVERRARHARRRRRLHRRRPADLWAGPMPSAWAVTEDMKNPPHYPLAVGRPSYVGDGVAVVLATQRRRGPRRARGHRRRLRPAAGGRRPRGRARDRVLVHEEIGTNKAYTWELKIGEEAVGRRLRRRRLHREGALHPAAPHRHGHGAPGVRRRAPALRRRHDALQRHPDPPHPQGDGRPHPGHPRAAAPRGGPVASAAGSARSSTSTPRSCCASALASKHRVPVRWVEERTEDAQATVQGRGQIQDIELAADADGKLTAHPGQPHRRHGRLPAAHHRRASRCSGPSSTPGSTTCRRLLFSCTGVHDDDADRRLPRRRSPRGHLRHRAGHGPPRGPDHRHRPGRAAAAQLHQGQEQFPYTAFTGLVYDSGDHDAAADKALEMVGYDAVRAEQATPGVPARRSSSASASRPTSRCAAWRRRGCSAR